MKNNTEIMQRPRTYLLLLYLTFLFGIVTYWACLVLFELIDGSSGLGSGIYLVVYATTFFFCLLVFTLLASLTFGVAFMQREKLSQSKIYHWSLPFAFCIPGYFFILYGVYLWLTNGL